jgi:hypothetical protein
MAKIKVTAGAGLKVRLPSGIAVEQPDYLESQNAPRLDDETEAAFAKRTVVEVENSDAFVVVGIRTGDLVLARPASRADVLKPSEIAKLQSDNNITTATDFDLQMPTSSAKKGE